MPSLHELTPHDLTELLPLPKVRAIAFEVFHTPSHKDHLHRPCSWRQMEISYLGMEQHCFQAMKTVQ